MRMIVSVMILAVSLVSKSATKDRSSGSRCRGISASTRQAFVDERFAALNEISQRYRIDKRRTASGLWRLTAFYAAISEEIHSQRDGQEREGAFREMAAKTTRWAQQYPASRAAHIAHSMVLIAAVAPRDALTHALRLIHHPSSDDSLKHFDIGDVLFRNR